VQPTRFISVHCQPATHSQSMDWIGLDPRCSNSAETVLQRSTPDVAAFAALQRLQFAVLLLKRCSKFLSRVARFGWDPRLELKAVTTTWHDMARHGTWIALLRRRILFSSDCCHLYECVVAFHKLSQPMSRAYALELVACSNCYQSNQ